MEPKVSLPYSQEPVTTFVLLHLYLHILQSAARISRLWSYICDHCTHVFSLAV